MHPSHMAHYAVACLEGLERPLTPQALSREQNVPIGDCLHILRRFEAAGLVQQNAEGAFERTCSIEQITAFEVLQALWYPQELSIDLLFGMERFGAEHVARLLARAADGPQG